MSSKQQVTFTLDAEILDRVDALATALDRSRGAVLRHAVEGWVIATELETGRARESRADRVVRVQE